MLSPYEKDRYNRHIVLPEIGIIGQEKIKHARVLIIGLGGLGSPAALYLAASGVGDIGLVDYDQVELSNLQRQILYGENDLGETKAVIAEKRLAAVNHQINLDVYSLSINENIITDLVSKYDIVIGAVDNSAARYIIDDAARKYEIPFIHGAVTGFEGQVAVFHYNGNKGYRELFPEPPEKDFNDEKDKGVIATLPGIVGTIQANEALKIITGCGEVLTEKMLIISGLNYRITFVSY